MTDLLDDLAWRGLLHQCTHLEGLREHLKTPGRRVYAGFDPTADSLTIGNLVPIVTLARFQQAGHQPVVVMGGGTGLIGDPSGKSAERMLLTEAQVEANVQAQRAIFERVLSFSGPCAATVFNNADWIKKLSFIQVLRDIGKHFAVNMMIQKDSVRERLQNREQGISYTEFSYMILQAYDFQYLAEHHNVSIELGGSDQWGNIVAGVDLTRRVLQREVFGLTSPLVTKADGGKFGKTEEGAVWLTAPRTSAYAFYQFWLNAADADVEKFLKIFTLLSRSEIEATLVEHQADPSKRSAQRKLASEVTAMLHGSEAKDRAEAASRALFSGEVSQLDLATLEEVFANAPASSHPRSRLNEGLLVVDLLVESGVVKSKREARQLLTSGAIRINGAPVGVEDRLTLERLLHGSLALIRKGKKYWHVTRWQ